MPLSLVDQDVLLSLRFEIARVRIKMDLLHQAASVLDVMTRYPTTLKQAVIFSQVKENSLSFQRLTGLVRGFPVRDGPFGKS